MRFPRGPGYVSVGFRPSPEAKERPTLSIGSRALVAARGGSSDRGVALTDDGGTSIVATVPDGTEVEVLAWRPRRGGDTRYLVAPRGGPEGWLGASCLRPRPVAVVPKRIEPTPAIKPAPAPPARARPRRAPARAAAPAKRTRR
jgi:hypothetical protein